MSLSDAEKRLVYLHDTTDHYLDLSEATKSPEHCRYAVTVLMGHFAKTRGINLDDILQITLKSEKSCRTNVIKLSERRKE